MTPSQLHQHSRGADHGGDRLQAGLEETAKEAAAIAKENVKEAVPKELVSKLRLHIC